MDLYALLGVGRAASAGEIERAYRRLARRYHPGVNPGDRMAEELFRQVQQAFEVLGDDERRREYDRGAARGRPGGGDRVRVARGIRFLGAGRRAAGGDVRRAVRGRVSGRRARGHDAVARRGHRTRRSALSFRDAVRGGGVPMSVVRQERCARVRRRRTRGAAAGRLSGLRRRGRAAMGARAHGVRAECDECDGAGRLSTQPCRRARGVGIQPRSEVVTMSVPAGVEHGDRLAVPGRGHAGARGGPAGDLYVTVEVEPHPSLHARGPRPAAHAAARRARGGARRARRRADARRAGPAADPAGHAVGPAVADSRARACRRRPARRPTAAGDLIVDVQIVLPPVRDERSKAAAARVRPVERRERPRFPV